MSRTAITHGAVLATSILILGIAEARAQTPTCSDFMNNVYAIREPRTRKAVREQRQRVTEWPIREADIARRRWHGRKVPSTDSRAGRERNRAQFVDEPRPRNPTSLGHGPFDFGGEYDDRSDRRQPLTELMSLGYEDAYHQFIEPVVGASGERVGGKTENRKRKT